MSNHTAIFRCILEEDTSKVGPFSGKQFIPEELNDIVDKEDTELEHILRLVFHEDLGEDVVDKEVGQPKSHILVGFEESTNELRNGHLHFFLLLDLIANHLLLLFVQVLS